MKRDRITMSGFASWTAGVLFLAVVAGCAENKLTRQNYDLLVEGRSTRLEAEKTLGDKYIDRGDHWEYEDMDRHLTVYLHWNGDGLIERKEWIDARTGEWEGAAPHMKQEPQGRGTSNETSTRTLKSD